MAPNKKQSSKNSTGSNLLWFFPSTDHGEAHGFADEQLEYFQGDHEKYIAREAIQNAVDARLDYEKPVQVIFEKLQIPASEMPGNNMLLDRMQRCLKFAAKDEKAVPFFKTAIELLKSSKIPVLKISDYNTKGLSGSDEDISGNWYRLVRAAGMSSPKGVAGGSFGIGKGAPIAASSLRTVFYSSVNENGEPVFQGKARLVSHIGPDNDIKQRAGFYGIKGYESIRNLNLIPDFFKRQKRGTDIFVMGYKAQDDWKERLIRSVLNNFWLAILNGDLEVLIKDGDKKAITKENLRDNLDIYGPEEARAYYEAATNWTERFEQELKHLGKCVLYVRKQDGYPRRVMMARKPRMVVQEKVNHVLREPYAGVFICDDERGNRLLRDLEPPAHDKWDRERSEEGPAAIRELDDFIKQSLKSMGEAMSTEPQDIPGLDRYLPDSEDRDYATQFGIEPLDTEKLSEEETGREVGTVKEPTLLETEKVIRKGIVTNKQPGKITTAPPSESDGGSKGRATGTGSGEKEGMRINTASINFRSFVQKSKDDLEYHFIITGREDCEGAIKIAAVGDDNTYPVELSSARDLDKKKEYEIQGSLIEGLEIKAGKTLRLAVKLASKKKYALGIENYAS